MTTGSLSTRLGGDTFVFSYTSYSRDNTTIEHASRKIGAAQSGGPILYINTDPTSVVYSNTVRLQPYAGRGYQATYNESTGTTVSLNVDDGNGASLIQLYGGSDGELAVRNGSISMKTTQGTQITGSLVASGSSHILSGSVSISGSLVTRGTLGVSGSLQLSDGFNMVKIGNNAANIGFFDANNNPYWDMVGGSTQFVLFDNTIGEYTLQALPGGETILNSDTTLRLKTLGSAGASRVDITTSDTTINNNLVVSASQVLTLQPYHPLPAAASYPGAFAVSASSPIRPYFSDGTAWNILF